MRGYAHRHMCLTSQAVAFHPSGAPCFHMHACNQSCEQDHQQTYSVTCGCRLFQRHAAAEPGLCGHLRAGGGSPRNRGSRWQRRRRACGRPGAARRLCRHRVRAAIVDELRRRRAARQPWFGRRRGRRLRCGCAARALDQGFRRMSVVLARRVRRALRQREPRWVRRRRRRRLCGRDLGVWHGGCLRNDRHGGRQQSGRRRCSCTAQHAQVRPRAYSKIR